MLFAKTRLNPPDPPSLLKSLVLVSLAVAFSNQSFATAPPPSVLLTILTSLSRGVSSVFSMEHVTLSPGCKSARYIA